jgi:hypothetical protein
MADTTVSEPTTEAFVPFGELGAPFRRRAPQWGDVALDLSRGKPGFYIMRLGQHCLTFDVMARHERATECLDALDGMPWLVAPTAFSNRRLPTSGRSGFRPTA